MDQQEFVGPKELEYLKSFFRFVHDSGWIKRNPAKAIKAPIVTDPPVLPFTDAELTEILSACETHRIQERGRELRALVLLMRHSGLRIGDACMLARDKIQGDILELRTAKYGTKVRLPLNPEAVKALKSLPARGDYYFWNGSANRQAYIKIWERTFNGMFKRAGIAGHSHQLRHKFAVGLLMKGVSMENVSTLLGHRSIKVTERYYASWVAGRQQLLEDVVRQTW